MNESPGIDLEPEVLLERLNPVDGSSGFKKGKANSYDWEFTPKDGERNAPERRLIEMWGAYQNDGALVTMRSKDGSGKGGKAGLYAKCAEVLNDEFASLPVKCDPVKVKNKIHFMQQQYESAQRKYNDHLKKAKTITGARTLDEDRESISSPDYYWASWTLYHSTLVEPEGCGRMDPRFRRSKDCLGLGTEWSEDVEDPETEGSISPASKSKPGGRTRGKGSSDSRKKHKSTADDEGVIDLTDIARQELSNSIDLTASFMDSAAAVSMAGKALNSIGIGSLLLALNNVGEKGEAFVSGVQEQVRQDIANGTMIQKRSELMYERADAFREKTVIRKADEGKDNYGLDEKIAKAAKLQVSLDKAKKTVSRTREKDITEDTTVTPSMERPMRPASVNHAFFPTLTIPTGPQQMQNLVQWQQWQQQLYQLQAKQLSNNNT